MLPVPADGLAGGGGARGDAAKAAAILAACTRPGTCAVVAFADDMRARFLAAFQALAAGAGGDEHAAAAATARVAAACVVIPQGIAGGAEAATPTPPPRELLAGDDLRAVLGLPPAARILLLVAGLREVKDPLFIADAFAAWRAEEGPAGAGGASPLAFVIVGPPLDGHVAAAVMRRCGVRPAGAGCGDDAGGGGGDAHARPFGGADGLFVHPPVPRARILRWLAQADVALNTSVSEGQCNALLEAMASGATPVVARRNDGNAALVAHGVTGWLFDTPEEAVAACRAVVGGPRAEAGRGQRPAGVEAVVAAARAYVAAAHDAEGEAAAWAGVLRRGGQG